MIIYELIELLCCVPVEYFGIVATTGDEDFDRVYMVTIGRIEEFCKDKEEWSQYTQRDLNISLLSTVS